jgi:4-hydroxy-tetrahydrodipicolinate synthase
MADDGATIGRLLTAMVTPFTPEGEIDYAQARRLAVALVESGSEGLVVTGSTGEAPALSNDEKVRMWSEVKEAIGDRAVIIAGAGTYSTRESVALAKEAERVGADGVMAVVPYYNKPTQEGLYLHFKAISEATPLPLIPYNVPSRTALNMVAETTVRLSELPNVVGVKEASGDFDQMAAILRDVRADFRVWSGNDSDTFALMCMGGYGIISLAAHLIGQQIRRMISLILGGELEAAGKEHQRQLAIAKGLFIISNPIPVKYGLNRAGFNVGGLRLPLVEADALTAAFLDKLLDGYKVDLPLTVSA